MIRTRISDGVEVDVAAIAGHNIRDVLLLAEGEDGKVVCGVTLPRLGPIEHAGDLAGLNEDMADLKVAVDEHRRRGTECGVCHPAVPCDEVVGKDAVTDEALTLAIEVHR